MNLSVAPIREQLLTTNRAQMAFKWKFFVTSFHWLILTRNYIVKRQAQ